MRTFLFAAVILSLVVLLACLFVQNRALSRDLSNHEPGRAPVIRLTPPEIEVAIVTPGDLPLKWTLVPEALDSFDPAPGSPKPQYGKPLGRVETSVSPEVEVALITPGDSPQIWTLWPGKGNSFYFDPRSGKWLYRRPFGIPHASPPAKMILIPLPTTISPK